MGSEGQSKVAGEALPEWKTVAPMPTSPVERCDLTEYTKLHMHQGDYGYGSLTILLSDYNSGWPKNGSYTQQCLALLQHVAAEMERTLPIVREMIRQEREPCVG